MVKIRWQVPELLPKKSKKRRPAGSMAHSCLLSIGIMCGDSISSSTKPQISAD
jgi:hypothetical protein